MRSRRAWARAFASILAGVMLAAPRAHSQSTWGEGEAIQLAAIELATQWLGPPPALSHGFAIDFQRPWPRMQRDQSYERRVIATVFHRMWQRPDLPRPQSPAPLNRFEEALAAYTATRAIHELLEGSNFAVVRFFGGAVPFPLRSVLLSPQGSHPRPRVWRIEELPDDPDVLPMVRSLQTIERYVGWPTLVQALAAMRSSGVPQLDVETLAATLSAIRGTDMHGLVTECFRRDAVFDYAIADVSSPAADTTPIETSVNIVRAGSGVFEAGTAADPERTMPVLVRFADGTERRDWFDGRAERATLVYTTNSRVVMAAIDPEVMLLLDQDRANNTFTTMTAIRPLGVRLALHWVSWLQQMMLTYSAIV